MKNKKKWASILTIATSLVLCIISTFGITLAFFGGNASANLSTITLKTGIEIGAAIESSVGSAKVVPGQPVKITATGTVSATTQGTNPDANNAVDGVVRAKFNVGNELGTVTIAGNNTDFWTAGGDGYYYLVTAENGTTLRTVSKGTSVQIFGDLIVSKNFTNADSGKSVEASVIFEVIQAGVYDSVTGNLVEMTVTNATTNTSPLYSAFDAVKVEIKELPTTYFYYNESSTYKQVCAMESYGDNGVVIYFCFPVDFTSQSIGLSVHLSGFSLSEKLSSETIEGIYFIQVDDGDTRTFDEYTDKVKKSANTYTLITPTIEENKILLMALNIESPTLTNQQLIENVSDLYWDCDNILHV